MYLIDHVTKLELHFGAGGLGLSNYSERISHLDTVKHYQFGGEGQFTCLVCQALPSLLLWEFPYLFMQTSHTIDMRIIFTFYILTDSIPTRLYVGIMIFISCVISYMLRTNLSINILAMVQSAPNSTHYLPDLRPDEPVLKNNLTLNPTAENTTTKIHVSVLPDVSINLYFVVDFFLMVCSNTKQSPLIVR